MLFSMVRIVALVIQIIHLGDPDWVWTRTSLKPSLMYNAMAAFCVDEVDSLIFEKRRSLQKLSAVLANCKPSPEQRQVDETIIR